MVIGSIDEDDVDGGLSQRLGGIEAAEASTDDDNSGVQCFSHLSKELYLSPLKDADQLRAHKKSSFLFVGLHSLGDARHVEDPELKFLGP